MIVADARVDAARDVVVAASAGRVVPAVTVTILVVVAVRTAVTVLVMVRVVVALIGAAVTVTVRVACALTVFFAVTVATITLGSKFDRERRMGCCFNCRFCLSTCTLFIGFARSLRKGEPSSWCASGVGLAKLAQIERKEKRREYFMSVSRSDLEVVVCSGAVDSRGHLGKSLARDRLEGSLQRMYV